MRDFRLKLLEQGDLARGHVGFDLVGDVLADAGDRGQLAIGVADDGGRRLREVVDRSGGVAIRSHAEDVRALKLQQIRKLVQRGGDLDIRHEVEKLRPSALTRRASEGVAEWMIHRYTPSLARRVRADAVKH